MKAETLKKLIDEYQKTNSIDKLADHIIELLEQEKEFSKLVRQLINEQEQDRINREKFSDIMREKWAKLQDRCPHWEFDYISDPSGGNDSYYECALCRKQW